MRDRKYGDYSRLLRVPELRMVDCETNFLTLAAPVDLDVHKPGKTCFYHLQQGRLRLFPDADPTHWVDLQEGSSIGLEDGSHHRWTTAPPTAEAHKGATGGEVKLVMGIIDRRHTIIQRLLRAIIVVPPDADPHASIIRHCIAAMAIDKARAQPSEAIARRFTEVIQLEMLLYAEASLTVVGPIPDAIRLDAALLRAWTAFLDDPARDWTLALLAEAAGISRSVFASRFRAVLGTTPLAAIREIRVHYASNMLRSTEAPITEIALKVGYRSDIALMRAFRQILGVTPAKLRMAARSLNVRPSTMLRQSSESQ